jgi:hypothetical protein
MVLTDMRNTVLSMRLQGRQALLVEGGVVRVGLVIVMVLVFSSTAWGSPAREERYAYALAMM